MIFVNRDGEVSFQYKTWEDQLMHLIDFPLTMWVRYIITTRIIYHTVSLVDSIT